MQEHLESGCSCMVRILDLPGVPQRKLYSKRGAHDDDQKEEETKTYDVM